MLIPKCDPLQLENTLNDVEESPQLALKSLMGWAGFILEFYASFVLQLNLRLYLLNANLIYFVLTLCKILGFHKNQFSHFSDFFSKRYWQGAQEYKRQRVKNLDQVTHDFHWCLFEKKITFPLMYVKNLPFLESLIKNLLFCLFIPIILFFFLWLI